MLSKEELARYGTGTLTEAFLDRVFQECLTYDGEMVSVTECHLPPLTCSEFFFFFIFLGLQDLLGFCSRIGEQERATGSAVSLQTSGCPK